MHMPLQCITNTVLSPPSVSLTSPPPPSLLPLPPSLLPLPLLLGYPRGFLCADRGSLALPPASRLPYIWLIHEDIPRRAPQHRQGNDQQCIIFIVDVDVDVIIGQWYEAQAWQAPCNPHIIIILLLLLILILLLFSPRWTVVLSSFAAPAHLLSPRQSHSQVASASSSARGRHACLMLLPQPCDRGWLRMSCLPRRLLREVILLRHVRCSLHAQRTARTACTCCAIIIRWSQCCSASNTARATAYPASYVLLRTPFFGSSISCGFSADERPCSSIICLCGKAGTGNVNVNVTVT